MGLLGGGETLAELAARIRKAPPVDTVELAALLERLVGHADTRPAAMAWLLSHPDGRVRAFSVDWFGSRAEPRVVESMLREMIGKPPQVRDEIARVVAKTAPRERVEAAVGKMMHSGEVCQREAGLSLIAAHPGWLQMLRHLKVALRDPVPALRQAAVRILSRGDGNRTVHLILLDLMQDDDPVVRLQAIPALARTPQPDIAAPFLERLSQEASDEQALMIDALQRLAGNPEARLAERLMPVLADEDDRVREAAVRLLAQMPNAVEILRSFLVYSRGLAAWLRDRAAASIMKISDDIVEPLVQLMHDDEADVRIGAVVMASACRDPRIVPRTIEIFLGADDWWVRSIAAEVLGNFPSSAVTAVLTSRMDDPDLRASVIAMLAKMHSPEATASLVGLLGHEDRGIRMATLEALAPIGGVEVCAALERVASGDPDPALRDKALVILESHRPAAESHLKDLAVAGQPVTDGAPEADLANLTMENEAL